MDGLGPKIGICCCCTLTLVGIILALVSIKTVEPIEYAIKYNSIGKTIEGDVYSGGWYMVGPQYSFITFPATLVNLDFTEFQGAAHGPIRTKDIGGQDILLSLSIQYRLKKDNIKDLYSEFQKDYEVRMANYIDSVVRDTVKNIPMQDFWRTEDGVNYRKRTGE